MYSPELVSLWLLLSLGTANHLLSGSGVELHSNPLVAFFQILLAIPAGVVLYGFLGLLWPAVLMSAILRTLK